MENKQAKKLENKDTKKKSLPDHSHNGHRRKMRERFYETGFKGMAEHNILEMLLYSGIPRKDTNQIAHDLIDMFGSLAGVFEADRLDLMKVKGMTETAACLISMVLPLYSCYTESLYRDKPDPVEPEEIAAYLRPKFMDGAGREKVYVLCYDYNKRLIACRLLNVGDFNSTDFDIRDFSRIVLETNCSSIIIAHNHPHSIHLPSQEDISLTVKIRNFLEILKVKLEDHIIVSDDNYSSLARSRKTMALFYGVDDDFEDHIKAVREQEKAERNRNK